MANVKTTKTFFRREVEDSYQSIVDLFKEFRDYAKVYRKQTRDESAAQEEQKNRLSNGELDKMIDNYNDIKKCVELLYADCKKIFFAVPQERRDQLARYGRPLKYLLQSVINRTENSPKDYGLVLMAFWTPASGIDAFMKQKNVDTSAWKETGTVIEQCFDESKIYEDELRKFKGTIMRYIGSAQFTRVINQERLAELWNIGQGEDEGINIMDEANRQRADGDDPSAGITHQIDYDSDAEDARADDENKTTKLAIREARDFINKKKQSTNNDDDDDDENVDAAPKNEPDDDAEIVPERVLKKGGKNLRRRTRATVDKIKAMARGARMQQFEDEQGATPPESSSSSEKMSGAEDSEEGKGAFVPEKSEDSDAASEDADVASRESADTGEVFSDGGGASDDENDDGIDDDEVDFDEEVSEKPKRKKPAPKTIAKKTKVEVEKKTSSVDKNEKRLKKQKEEPEEEKTASADDDNPFADLTL
jgi:hypothetical protein